MYRSVSATLLWLFVAGAESDGQPPLAAELGQAPMPVHDESAWNPFAQQIVTGFEAEGIEHCGPWVLGPYHSVQVNVDEQGCNIVDDAANEPSIAIDPTDPRRMVIGWRQFDTVYDGFRQAGWAYSHDGGATWIFPGVLDPGVFGSDPVLDADSDGVFYYVSLDLSQLRLFRSCDAGLAWESPVTVENRLSDKPWMAIDRTNGLGRGHIYVIGDNARISRSIDGGRAFEQPIGLPSLVRFGTLSVGSDGTLYAGGARSGGGAERFVMARYDEAWNKEKPLELDAFDFVDLDGFLLSFLGPNGGLNSQVWIASDHSFGPTRGNVYLLACTIQPDTPWAHVHIARSTDRGNTWSEAVSITGDSIRPAYRWFGTMSVAPNGRIDVVWNHTDIPVVETELRYAYSTDGARTWSREVAVSPPFRKINVGAPGKLGDYYDMISDSTAAHVAYAATFNEEQDVYFLRIDRVNCTVDPGPDGDYDGDGDVDLYDLSYFQNCYNGVAQATGVRNSDPMPSGDTVAASSAPDSTLDSASLERSTDMPARDEPWRVGADYCGLGCPVFNLDGHANVDPPGWSALASRLTGPTTP